MSIRIELFTEHSFGRLAGLFFVFFLTLSLLHLVFPSAFAQVNCVITKVGDPKGPPPADCGDSSSNTPGGANPPAEAPSEQPPPDASPGNFVFYCQGDSDWNSQGAACLASAGCGPTSLAMIMSTFGVRITPPEVDAVFQQNGWRQGCGGGSAYGPAIESSWFQSRGFTVGPNVASTNEPDLALMKKFIDEGYIIYNGVDNYPCLGCIEKFVPVGHVFNIDQVDVGSRRVHVRDPNNCSFDASGRENPENTRWLSLDAPIRTGGLQGTAWNGSFPIKRK